MISIISFSFVYVIFVLLSQLNIIQATYYDMMRFRQKTVYFNGIMECETNKLILLFVYFLFGYKVHYLDYDIKKEMLFFSFFIKRKWTTVRLLGREYPETRIILYMLMRVTFLSTIPIIILIMRKL